MLKSLFSKPFRTLGRHIFFWMVLLALGPIIVVAYQGYHCARQAIVENQQAHLRSVLESKKERLLAKIDEIRSDFRFIAETPCVRGDCASPPVDGGRNQARHVCRLLDNLQKGNPSYETIASYDVDWNRIYHTNQGIHDEEGFLTPEFTSKIRESRELVLEPAHFHEGGKIGFHAGTPAFNADGDVAGYIVANVDLSSLIDSILQNRAGLGETGKAYLLSFDWRYLTTPQGAQDLLGKLCGLVEEVGHAGSLKIHGYEDHRGIRVLGASTAIPILDWRLVVEIDQEEAFSWLGILRKRALITGGITLILILFVSVRISYKLSQPLQKLAAVSSRIADGHREDRLGRLEGVEAQEVAEAFNKMLDKLEESHRRLVDAASLAAVGELSSSIVHEMRNPLSSITMNLKALRLKVEGDDSYSELADIALNQAVRLERMLSDLLGYGKPLQANPSMIAFGNLVGEVVELVRNDAQDKGVSIEVDDKMEENRIFADPEQLRGALVNLTMNAIQASPEGGQVLIAARALSGDPTKISISIGDSGPGIPESHKDEIFKPFFTTRDKGTGLGLANVKKIVDYHGGTVSSKNRAEGGAVFEIVLPLGGRR